MAKAQKPRMIQSLPLTGAPLKKPIDLARAGMPAGDTIHDVTAVPAKASRPAFQILHTTETDAYDKAAPQVASLLRAKKAPSSAAVASALKPAPTGDNFAGTARRDAKLSKATAKTTEKFADVQKLIASLPKQTVMANHKPKIGTGATSGRVKEEQRNVSLKGFLYAASREADNDFHLIIGRDPKLSPEMYMTMEVSGLPPKDPKYDFADLNAARKAFKAYFGANLPGPSYDFYHPPRPVQIQGSLFWDATHAKGTAPGPPSLKSRMPVIWEVHPITSIKLG
jgi:hypothetical protein